MTKKRVLLSLALAAVVFVAGGAVLLLDLKHHPWKLYDEWQCSQGEAPYFNRHGGSACAREGSRLPRGARWDPLGNRPFDCDDRDGWTPISNPRTGAPDCLRNGLPTPSGHPD